MTDQDRAIWKAGYDLHVKYGDGPKTEADWMRMTEDCRDLYNRFGRGEFAFRMALMMLEYYNDIYRKKTPAVPEQLTMGM